MNDFYTVKFLYNTLYLLSKEIEDLEKWSVHNNDTRLDEISELKERFEALKQDLFEIGGKDIDRTNIHEEGGGKEDL